MRNSVLKDSSSSVSSSASAAANLHPWLEAKLQSADKIISYNSDNGEVSLAKRNFIFRVGNNVFYSAEADRQILYYKIQAIEENHLMLHEINSHEQEIDSPPINLDLLYEGSLTNLRVPTHTNKIIHEYHAFISENPDYEVFEDTREGLQYVRLRASGARKIIAQYQVDPRYAHKNINIKVFEEASGQSRFAGEEFDHANTSSKMYKKILKAGKILKDGSSIGLIFIDADIHNTVIHTSPFLLTKVGAKTILLDFEGTIFNDGEGDELFSTDLWIVKGINPDRAYRFDETNAAQADSHSCTIFALNNLKHCFVEDDFIANLRLPDPRPTEELITDLPRTSLGQTRNHKEILSADKQNKYFEKVELLPWQIEVGEEKVEADEEVKDDEEKWMNRKAFVKGHYYAERINPHHTNGLNQATFDLFDEIDSRRQEAKSAKLESASSSYAAENVEEEVDELAIPEEEIPSTIPSHARHAQTLQKDNPHSAKKPRV